MNREKSKVISFDMSNRVKDEEIEIVKSKENEILNKEILDIYDKYFNKIGTSTRGEIHEKGHIHKVVHCWFEEDTENGKYCYFQQRAMYKSYPGLYGVMVGGHIDSGEDVFEALKREISEEAGIVAKEENISFINEIFENIVDGDFIDNEICDGEDVFEALKREISEEAGIVAKEENISFINEIFENIVDGDFIDNEICEVYRYKVDEDTVFNPNKEVAKVVRMNEEEYKKCVFGITNKEVAKVVRMNEEEYKKCVFGITETVEAEVVAVSNQQGMKEYAVGDKFLINTEDFCEYDRQYVRMVTGMSDDEYFMMEALREAKKAYEYAVGDKFLINTEDFCEYDRQYVRMVTGMSDDEYFMMEALREAKKAYDKEETPIGAVIVKDGEIIGRGHNLTEHLKDATAHSEILAIKNAAKKLKGWRLFGCKMYVTMEPCIMCCGAIVNSRIREVVIGAKRVKNAKIEKQSDFKKEYFEDSKVEYKYGVLEEECAGMLGSFFKRLR